MILNLKYSTIITSFGSEVWCSIIYVLLFYERKISIASLHNAELNKKIEMSVVLVRLPCLLQLYLKIEAYTHTPNAMFV